MRFWLQRFDNWGATREDHIGLQRNQFLRRRRYATFLAGGEAVIEDEISPILPAQLFHDIEKGRNLPLPFWILGFRVCEHSDPTNSIGLLSASCRGVY